MRQRGLLLASMALCAREATIQARLNLSLMQSRVPPDKLAEARAEWCALAAPMSIDGFVRLCPVVVPETIRVTAYAEEVVSMMTMA